MFVVKFPRVKIIHPITVLLKGVFDLPTFRPKIHLYITNTSFHLLITAKSKLQYYNRFDYSTVADMVYHILFVLEQKEMDQKKMEVNIFGVEKRWPHLDQFQEFFESKINLSDQVELAEHFLISKQTLCV